MAYRHCLPLQSCPQHTLLASVCWIRLELQRDDPTSHRRELVITELCRISDRDSSATYVRSTCRHVQICLSTISGLLRPASRASVKLMKQWQGRSQRHYTDQREMKLKAVQSSAQGPDRWSGHSASGQPERCIQLLCL